MSNRLEDLHPLFQPIAKAILQETQAEFDEHYPGSTIRAADTFRLMTAQAAAVAAGLSRVAIGWHQFGLAVDGSVITREGAYVKDGADPRYRLFGLAAIRHGCIWGGTWTHPDWDHIEWHPGFTLQQYTSWLDAHKVGAA